MGAFLTTLELEELSQDHWRLLQPLIYRSEILPVPGEILTVPRGFETDLESVPRWLPLVYALFYGTAHAAAVVHDWLYTTGRYPRRLADAVLYEAMRAKGEPVWKSYTMWLGVRIGGGWAWENHRKVEGISV